MVFFKQSCLHLQVPIKNIERELICPICKELFTHPLILPCQHSVCHKCVRELLMLNHEDSFDAGSECSMPGSPRSRVPSPSMERLDRLVRSGGSRGKEPEILVFLHRLNKYDLYRKDLIMYRLVQGSGSRISLLKSIWGFSRNSGLTMLLGIPTILVMWADGS